MMGSQFILFYLLIQSASSFLLVPSRVVQPARKKSALYSNSNQFDLAKPVFDLFTLRTIRGDAMLRYNSLNQSEPLRINLFALLALTLFAAPFTSEAVGGEALGFPETVGSVLGGLGSVVLFVRECQKRSNQLYRMEKELNSESLKLRLPMNPLSDAPFTEPATFGQLRDTSNPPRLLVICGTKSQLSASLQSLSILGRRLRQATTFVVPVPTDGSTRLEWNVGADRIPWLADPHEIDNWLRYFDDLSDKSDQFRWLGLNSKGRSFGSGVGESPQLLQLLGQYLRPTSILDDQDANIVPNEDAQSVFDAQAEFYNFLVNGDVDGMRNIWWENPAQEVSEVIEAGGRIDEWESCLEDGARPAGMKIAGADVSIISDTEAYSTVIEFPAEAAAEGMTATLLAIQQWKRESNTWKLVVHQTIPWTSETKAFGTLRCDFRGCVALTRDTERRTFGGLIR